MLFEKEKTQLRLECNTKSDWIKVINSYKEKLNKTPKEIYRSPPPCSHDQGEYGNCSCHGSYHDNYHYTELENTIKYLYSLANSFCDKCSNGLLLPPNAAFCYSCGEKKEYSNPFHTNCPNYSIKFKFCPDCANPCSPTTIPNLKAMTPV